MMRESRPMVKLTMTMKTYLVTYRAGKATQAVENLNAFISQAERQTGKGLTAEQTDRLTTDALRIRAVIGG